MSAPATYFDYDVQAWVRDGRYVRCGHPESMRCTCYGRLHEGELADSPVDDEAGPGPRCEDGQHEYRLARYCGAHVCEVCEDHRGLTRCYCGWSASGGDGRRELVDMGEMIDEDWS